MPLIVCSDKNSRAQSMALVMKVHLKLLRQHKKPKSRHNRVITRLTTHVNADNSKTHHHFRSPKHNSPSLKSETLPAVLVYTLR